LWKPHRHENVVTIPLSQFETWSSQESITHSKNKYASIRRRSRIRMRHTRAAISRSCFRDRTGTPQTSDILLKIVQWLYETNRHVDFVCANQQYYLLQDNYETCWAYDDGWRFYKRSDRAVEQLVAVIRSWALGMLPPGTRLFFLEQPIEGVCG
jgi:hypothetical protein